MKLKIISDGGMYSTKIVNTETNEILDMVYSVTWSHVAGEAPEAIVTLHFIPVEITVDADVELVDPSATPR